MCGKNLCSTLISIALLIHLACCLQVGHQWHLVTSGFTVCILNVGSVLLSPYLFLPKEPSLVMRQPCVFPWVFGYFMHSTMLTSYALWSFAVLTFHSFVLYWLLDLIFWMPGLPLCHGAKSKVWEICSLLLLMLLWCLTGLASSLGMHKLICAIFYYHDPL